MAYKFVDADKLDSDLTAVADAIREKGGTSETLAFPDGFNTAIMAIESGAELNFDIVGSPDAPSNPKDNTIWVNTNVPITGWTFSATQPEAPVDVQDGWVWFSTDNSSEVSFNALKKNGIQVYPISAKQYISGKWDEKPTQSRQGDQWVEWWNGELYQNGNQYETATGGWKVVNGAGETATLDTNCIKFAKTGSDDRSASAYTQNSIDVSKFSSLVVSGKIITASSTTSKDAIVLGLTSTNTASEPKSWVHKHILNTVGAFEFALDIGSVNESYYVALYAHASDVEVYTVQLK